MPKRLFDQPLTNAEKQARHRAKKKAEGLTRREVWTAPDQPPSLTKKPAPRGKRPAAAAIDALQAELAAAKKAQQETEAKYQALLRHDVHENDTGKIEAALAFAAVFTDTDKNKVAALFKTLKIPLFLVQNRTCANNLQEEPPGRIKARKLNALKKAGAFS